MVTFFKRMLKFRKSAGVHVTAATYLLIRRGDEARKAQRWEDAATAYHAALDREPSLTHVRIQLAHMLKHAGALDKAIDTYAEAARINVNDAEPLVHQAHLSKRRYGLKASTRLFLSALARGDWQGEAERDLRDVLGPTNSVPLDMLRAIAQSFGDFTKKDEPSSENTTCLSTLTRPLLFDITDLIGHFRRQRSPTGIQRVQIEVLDSVLSTVAPTGAYLSCFVSGRGDPVEVAVGHFRQLVALARSDDDVTDPEWQRELSRVLLQLAVADQLIIPFQAVLINLGASSWVSDYFIFVRNAKLYQQISYFPFVHDLIPFLLPEYCVPGTRREFSRWLAGLFQHANGFLLNSKSTAHDLEEVAIFLGHEVTPETLILTPLDAATSFGTTMPPVSILAKWGLQDTAYALMVSTIEPRKNHVLAFDAWAALIRNHGASLVPRLVCVGRDGWLNDHVFARLAADPALMAAVTIIHSISDAELALLYQCSCFTLYPSLYEGWGLPITESLSYCKVPIVANNSSLPEAGSNLALLFESNSVIALMHAVEKVTFDEDWRLAQQSRIESEYSRRSWSDIAKGIVDATLDVKFTDKIIESPRIQEGIYYPVTLHSAETIWPGLVSGEIFRIGHGWLWPEPEGCRTTSQGGVLRLRLATDNNDEEADAEEGGRRLYLRLRGLACLDCIVTISTMGEVVHAAIPAGALVWVRLDLTLRNAPTIFVTIQGDLTEEVMLSIGGRDAAFHASVAVVGLLLCVGPDEEADKRMIKSIKMWRDF